MRFGEVAMDAADLRVPDIPLASCDDEDIDSNKNLSNHSSDEKHYHTSSNNSNSDEERLHDEFSGSLEDLVGNFDEKIAACLKDHEVTTADIAPVQIRTQEEVMNESQTWWTLTGNFGNIQPLDFGTSSICKKMAAALDSDSLHKVLCLDVFSPTCPIPHAPLTDQKVDNLQKDDASTRRSMTNSDDEDLLRQQMDVHQMIGHHHGSTDTGGETPPQTADQVIEEIDEMLQSCDFTGSMMTDRTMESVDSMYSSMRSPYPSSIQSSEADIKLRSAQALVSNPDNLQELSYSKLVTLCAEMEQLIRVYNESLVDELAHRDELDYEKEMKNSFISLLLAIQNKRRVYANDRKRKGGKASDASQLPQYLTATIPYNDNQHIDNASIASLIKILRAIHDDSTTVPTLLTDYILTHVCPKNIAC
ncbi:hypothetical protein L3Y34_009015 [Caenorhabditis briggsae]|uniref:Protein CBR-UNC-76 n=1 Tax=Caenorhabditis briggsae TaxID=6238 RepID=A0AAE9AB78_CAEBR|nr:hypothetical protein L3Y34_009015 [Caenorhabditis briggsae]